MENFKNKLDGVSSKILKLLTLVVGLSAAEQAVSQVPIEQLIIEAKAIEIKLSENAVKNGQLSLINNFPAATISNDSSRVQFRYSDTQRTKPVSVLMYKNKRYYWDSNSDGKIDGIYIDNNEDSGKMPTDEEFMQVKLLIMSGGPSQTELELSDMMNEGKGNNYVFVNLEKNTFSDTSDSKVMEIPESDKSRVSNSIQSSFVLNLKDWKVF